MKKLFENVDGNRFKLLTESVSGQELVISGLKKVFNSGLNEISYKRIESVGLGYIKDVSTAQRVAIEEAKNMSSEFGFVADEENEKFVKENNVETVPYVPGGNSSEEKREVQIGNEILKFVNNIQTQGYDQHSMSVIERLAKELITMHGGK